jgi:peptidylprolyl isomerase
MHNLLFAAALLAAEPDVAKISEALGHAIGKSLYDLGVDFDLEAIAKGIKEEAEGKESPMDAENCAKGIELMQDNKISSLTDSALLQEDAVANDILSQ